MISTIKGSCVICNINYCFNKEINKVCCKTKEHLKYKTVFLHTGIGRSIYFKQGCTPLISFTFMLPRTHLCHDFLIADLMTDSYILSTYFLLSKQSLSHNIEEVLFVIVNRLHVYLS